MANPLDFDDGKEPLIDYPWYGEVDRLADWLKGQDTDVKCFAFDLIMSLAYIDATSGLERYLEYCPNAPNSYNLHLGFINLCSPCYEKTGKWVYQKAAKPQSGALGKLSSEVILRFILKLSKNLNAVTSIGGVDSVDAVLIHENGCKILAEVKSAPLITYPILLWETSCEAGKEHAKPNLTNSQFAELESALYLHEQAILPLGKPKDDLWPFKMAVEFITNSSNQTIMNSAANTWEKAKLAYMERNKGNPLYFLANASGNPPKIAKERDNWPGKESISDSKTSAGMDRTDDIKKGIYQVMKIGTIMKNLPEAHKYKTAIISNLPAYRHGEDYVNPFLNMLWGLESDLEQGKEGKFISIENLRRIFDFIITIDDPVLRELEL
ncbi:hypothetical protein UR09_05440 [Candidatus Nitromaritima sp. SCGC AAA799-A02]|nr:hypothetical protein UR09_05440 [Candidatus Nitromaritima sp. SCGC AAA799-A02]KMP11496.1 hypothetical protein UZ36_04150 [Candidatus Nitromaritima sp. SCGC AAA799-C22]